MIPILFTSERFVRPNNPEERNFGIFGQKLSTQDSVIFNNFKEDYLSKLKTLIKIYNFSFSTLFVIAFVAIFSPSIGVERFWSVFIGLIMLLGFCSVLIYILIFFPYTWMGVYSRSWIKFFERKKIFLKINISEKFFGTYPVVLFPAIKSYLNLNNVSIFINDDEIKALAPLSANFNKIKGEHERYDSSIIKFNE